MAWPNNPQTRRSRYTGIPLDRLHRNHPGWCYRPVVFQWQSSVNLNIWNKLEYNWSHRYIAIGATLDGAYTQWYPSGNPVLICIIGTHWITTGTWSPLDAHWKHTGYQQFFLRWYSSVHWGLSSRHTGLPLNYHCLSVTPQAIIYCAVVYKAAQMGAMTAWKIPIVRLVNWVKCFIGINPCAFKQFKRDSLRNWIKQWGSFAQKSTT